MFGHWPAVASSFHFPLVTHASEAAALDSQTERTPLLQTAPSLSTSRRTKVAIFDTTHNSLKATTQVSTIIPQAMSTSTKIYFRK